MLSCAAFSIFPSSGVQHFGLALKQRQQSDINFAVRFETKPF
jgi:hypothetical protein